VFENCLYSLQWGSGAEIGGNALNSDLILRTVRPEKLQLKKQQLLTANVVRVAKMVVVLESAKSPLFYNESPFCRTLKCQNNSI